MYKANGRFAIVDGKDQPVCTFGGTTYSDQEYERLRDEFLLAINPETGLSRTTGKAKMGWDTYRYKGKIYRWHELMNKLQDERPKEETPKEQAKICTLNGLVLRRGKDGHWLEFRTKGGVSMAINIENHFPDIPYRFGNDAVRKWASEQETEEEVRCGCDACSGEIRHDSDCAVHNMPASPNGECNCESGLASSESVADRFAH